MIRRKKVEYESPLQAYIQRFGGTIILYSWLLDPDFPVYGLKRKTVQHIIKEHPKLIYFGITNPNQRKAAAELKKLGFKMVTEYRNPNTGNKLKVWVFKPRTD